MEIAVVVFLLLPTYLLLRIMLGHHMTQEDRDKKFYQKGYGLIQAREFEAALQFFSAELNKNPDSAVAFDYRARAYYALGQEFEAITDANQAIRLAPSLPFPYLTKARVLVELQENEHALRELEKATWYGHEFAEAYCLKGRLHLAMGNTKKAHEDLAVAKSYGDEEANFLLMKLEGKVRA